jgi:hypothetical protein
MIIASGIIYRKRKWGSSLFLGVIFYNKENDNNKNKK